MTRPEAIRIISRGTGEGTSEMKIKKLLLFALGVAVVVAGVLALNKRNK